VGGREERGWVEERKGGMICDTLGSVSRGSFVKSICETVAVCYRAGETKTDSTCMTMQLGQILNKHCAYTPASAAMLIIPR